jgi:hypothetical protein
LFHSTSLTIEGWEWGRLLSLSLAAVLPSPADLHPHPPRTSKVAEKVPFFACPLIRVTPPLSPSQVPTNDVKTRKTNNRIHFKQIEGLMDGLVIEFF